MRIHRFFVRSCGGKYEEGDASGTAPSLFSLLLTRIWSINGKMSSNISAERRAVIFRCYGCGITVMIHKVWELRWISEIVEKKVVKSGELAIECWQ